MGTQGGSFPEEERTQAEKAVVEARMALNAHLARVRTQDAELLALTEQAKALRARLDATLADRPAVAEARAKIDGMNARMSDLVAEQDRILKSDTGSPSDGNPSN